MPFMWSSACHQKNRASSVWLNNLILGFNPLWPDRKKPAVCPYSAGRRRSSPSRGRCLDSQRCRLRSTGWKATEACRRRFNIVDRVSPTSTLHTNYSSLPNTVQTEPYSHSSYLAQSQRDCSAVCANAVQRIFIDILRPFMTLSWRCTLQIIFKMNFRVSYCF